MHVLEPSQSDLSSLFSVLLTPETTVLTISFPPAVMIPMTVNLSLRILRKDRKRSVMQVLLTLNGK